MNPLVSVVIPTYNGERSLEKAVLSVQRQTYPAMEIIIIDDGSTDGTGDLIAQLKSRDARIISLKNPDNLGFVASLNRGASRATGKYIARIDDDDAWIDERKLEKQIGFLEAHPDHVLVGGGIVITVQKTGREVVRYLFPEKDHEIRESLLLYNLFAHSAVAFRRDVFVQAGGYEERFGFFADRALWLKLGTLGKMYNFQEYFIAYADKEIGSTGYSSRDTQIRRKLGLRLSLRWQYRAHYPHFLKSSLFAFVSYGYSFLPFRERLKPMLFSLRTKLLRAPYQYTRK